MDYQYLDLSDPNCDINGNKFGLDNVLMVMDYSNTKSIFSHFYGVETDFKGYIQKFCNKGIFKYSLKEQQEIYILDMIQKVTDVPLELVKKYFTSNVLLNKTIRLTCSSFNNVDSQIKQECKVEFNSKKHKLHVGTTRIFIIMRRLGISDDDIINKTESLIIDDAELILPYIASYLLIWSGVGIFGSLDVRNDEFKFKINRINENGTVSYEKFDLSSHLLNNKYDKYGVIIAMILKVISK